MDFDIVPQRIALRLIDCATEVARECLEDLGRMRAENDQIRTTYLAAQSGGERELRAYSYALSHDPDGIAVSAFRGGTYDLLKRLATREAVRAALQRLDRDRQPKAVSWLARFHEFNGTRFDGEHGYNVADDFLRALLSQMPSVSSDGSFCDPSAIAEVVLSERERAASQWREQLATVPADMLELKRVYLSKGLR
ncbi:hypothetical protein T492DRAFT_976831 [Pavlovales sp. CCMP2436]|nr:hypothetical protein T492DRAFT_976831 [Pavlovales sp. CCMP2436]